MIRGIRRRQWWLWPVIAVLLALTLYGLALLASTRITAANAVTTLHQ